MISLSHVSLMSRETGTTILDDITWHVDENSKWILFGRNGSGKTRLLEIITGYLYPSSGSVVRFGDGQTGCDVRDVRRHIGYVSTPLRERMYHGETILDIILSGVYGTAALFDEVEESLRCRAMDLLRRTGLGGRENDSFNLLSDGERQKIMMARAFIADPDVLLLDEPCAGLDLGAREDLLSTLEMLAPERKVSIIFVTHHVDEILPLFDRILIIHRGRALYQGPVDGGLSHERMTELFERPVEITLSRGRYYSLLR